MIFFPDTNASVPQFAVPPVFHSLLYQRERRHRFISVGSIGPRRQKKKSAKLAPIRKKMDAGTLVLGLSCAVITSVLLWCTWTQRVRIAQNISSPFGIRDRTLFLQQSFGRPLARDDNLHALDAHQNI
jgi:hypothetical protein